jgi:glycine oxidase
MARAPTATVAGAGALGLSCALALADAGFAVSVHDPGPPFAGASGVAAGMLAPVFEAVLDEEARPHFDVLTAARDLWPALAARAGVALDRSGALAVGRAEWLQAVALRMRGLGLPAAELSRAAARDLAPGLAPGLAGGLMTGEDWRLDARGALAALRRAAAAAGVVFHAAPLRERGAADLLVLATGAARGLEELAPETAGLSPIKGHILRLGVTDALGAVLRGEGVYVAPGAGGLVVGATMEAGVADPTPQAAQAAPLLARGAGLLPALANAPWRLQAGVRAATPDGLPLAGFGATPGVLLATGARRNGWLLAPLVAGVVAALATGRDPGRYAARLDPRRYG